MGKAAAAVLSEQQEMQTREAKVRPYHLEAGNISSSYSNVFGSALD